MKRVVNKLSRAGFTPVHTNSKKVAIYNDDCVSIMRNMADESIDMIFADPPYYGNQSGSTISRTDGSPSFSTDKASWARKRATSKQLNFHYEWLAESQRILKEGGTIWVTGTYHSIGYINVVMHDLGFKLLNEIILYKRNAPPNFKGTCFRAVTENMIWAKKNSRGKKVFNYWETKRLNGGKQMSNIWEYSAKKNPFRHPATKQPFVLDRCVRAGTRKGDVIFDPFGGAGTTGFVAQALDRYSIMAETDNKYAKLAARRVDGKYGEHAS